MNPQLTCSQRQWLHSSVGRASHRYREVTGSNSVEVLNFFQASLRNCINWVHCDDYFLIFISLPQFIYDLFHISLTIIIIIKDEKLNNAEMASESQYQTFYQLEGEMRDHHNLSRLNVTSLLQEIGR